MTRVIFVLLLKDALAPIEYLINHKNQPQWRKPLENLVEQLNIIALNGSEVEYFTSLQLLKNTQTKIVEKNSDQHFEEIKNKWFLTRRSRSVSI